MRLGAERGLAYSVATMATSPARLPNIVLIVADDLGYGDLSCLNSEGKIPTPHHDRVAAEGMAFTDAHSSSAVCTPSRYSILTGRYAWRTWMTFAVLGGLGRSLIEPGRPTLASLLKDAGYRTACIGKWHLGLDWATREGFTLPDSAWGYPEEAVDYNGPVRHGPHTLGFDVSCVLPGSLDMSPYVYVDNGTVTDLPLRPVEPSDRPAFYRGGVAGGGFEHEHVLLELTRRAEQFIDTRAAERPGEPFLLYFPTTAPHTPHLPRAPFVGKSGAGNYGDFVCEHDWSVGRILDALDRHGLAENTLVIVTSDNGSHTGPLDLERLYGHRGNFIYRGQKSDAWDGGHRVPLLVRWPGIIEPGRVCDQTVCLGDWFATFAALIGQPVPDGAGEDSFNLLELLRGVDRPVRDHVVHHSIKGDFAIRQGRWKLVLCAGSGGWSLPEDLVPPGNPPVQLYDMQADPAEQHNLQAERPEIVAELRALVDTARNEGRTAPW